MKGTDIGPIYRPAGKGGNLSGTVKLTGGKGCVPFDYGFGSSGNSRFGVQLTGSGTTQNISLVWESLGTQVSNPYYIAPSNCLSGGNTVPSGANTLLHAARRTGRRTPWHGISERR